MAKNPILVRIVRCRIARNRKSCIWKQIFIATFQVLNHFWEIMKSWDMYIKHSMLIFYFSNQNNWNNPGTIQNFSFIPQCNQRKSRNLQTKLCKGFSSLTLYFTNKNISYWQTYIVLYEMFHHGNQILDQWWFNLCSQTGGWEVNCCQGWCMELPRLQITISLKIFQTYCQAQCKLRKLDLYIIITSPPLKHSATSTPTEEGVDMKMTVLTDPLYKLNDSLQKWQMNIYWPQLTSS